MMIIQNEINECNDSVVRNSPFCLIATRETGEWKKPRDSLLKSFASQAFSYCINGQINAISSG